jgi:exodeoxyribonuclease X
MREGVARSLLDAAGGVTARRDGTLIITKFFWMSTMKLIIVDTETSDLDPRKGAQILELAWLELSFTPRTPGVDWKHMYSGEYYIQYDGPISPLAQAVHHIPPHKLTKDGGAVLREEAIRVLLDHTPQDSFMVAHNVVFDSGFLPELQRPWICTLRCARHLWPEAPGYSNQVLRYWLKLNPFDIEPLVEYRYPHQALYDVATTASILLKMLERCTVEQLLTMSNTPVRLKKIGFGKHRGMDFDQLPPDYIRWLRGQSNLDTDVMHTLNSILHK